MFIFLPKKLTAAALNLRNAQPHFVTGETPFDIGLSRLPGCMQA